MVINNIEVDFKITRPKDAEAYEKAMAAMQKSEKAIRDKYKKGNLKLSEVLVELISLLSNFFVNATGKDVLSGVDDYEEAQEIYLGFLQEVTAQQEVFTKPYSRFQIDAEV